MFETIKAAPAAIFDMRALFSSPIYSATGLRYQNNDSGTTQLTSAQTISPRNGKEIYRGKVVMLINEYAQSWAEQVALGFEAARPDITFIGTPTAGAMGNVTTMVLPGNITVSFTYHNVRHADGRQLQRVGIQPTIKAASTIKGIVEGKDEVLEAAVKFLQLEIR